MNDEMNFTSYLSQLSRPEFAKCKIFQMEREKTALNTILSRINALSSRVTEVVRRHEGPSPKSLDLDENFKSESESFYLKMK